VIGYALQKAPRLEARKRRKPDERKHPRQDHGSLADKGFFLFRVNEDQSDGVELSEPPTPDQRAVRHET
jgi:hypothetical protein